jgi:phosphoribosyl 1,2-cyclic phosphate phosphodiesterase
MIGCDCAVCQSTDPRDTRLRSSVMLATGKTRLVVDTTPDFRYQMLRSGTRQLDAILYTHPHKDHIAGLDDVRAFNFFSGKAMDVYAGALTEEALRRDFYYAFSDTRYPGVPELSMHPIGMEPFQIGDIPVLPIEVWHLRMPVHAFRFGNFTYVTDANRLEADEKEKIRGSSVLVLNALRKEKHISHFNLEEALELVRELEVPMAYFTHISHQLGLHEDINRELPEGVELAYDGLHFSVELS